MFFSASPTPLRAAGSPLGAEEYSPHTKTQIIIQWLKFKNFLLMFLASLRSGFRHVTSTLLHPLLAPGCSCLCCKAQRLGWDGMVTAGWGSTEAPTPAEVAKCCCNTNKDPVLGCCLKLMGWRGTKGLSKGFGEALGQPLPIVDASFSICKSRG